MTLAHQIMPINSERNSNPPKVAHNSKPVPLLSQEKRLNKWGGVLFALWPSQDPEIQCEELSVGDLSTFGGQ